MDEAVAGIQLYGNGTVPIVADAGSFARPSTGDETAMWALFRRRYWRPATLATNEATFCASLPSTICAGIVP